MLATQHGIADKHLMKLGRIKPTPVQKAFVPKLHDFLIKPLPPAPPTCNNTNGAPIAMWGNDTLGDCTFAGLTNFKAICSVKEKIPFNTTAAEVEKAYLKFTGGRDEGAIETLVLNKAESAGFDFGEKEPWKIVTKMSVPIKDEATCKSLISLFYGLYLGVELPTAAQNEQIWTTPKNMAGVNSIGSWGGHCLLWGNYDTTDMRDLVTWGGIQRAEQGWLNAYCDQAYVILDEDRAKVIGVDWNSLLSYLRSIPRT